MERYQMFCRKEVVGTLLKQFNACVKTKRSEKIAYITGNSLKLALIQK